LLALVLAGCASYGEPSAGFLSPQVGAAYQPLAKSDFLFLRRLGAAVTVAPHIAVTNAHNANLVQPDAILARSRDYDLLFFRTDDVDAAPVAKAETGAMVIAYGQGGDGELREARGVVHALAERVDPRCDSCAMQQAISFDAPAGPGFSGGPLVDMRGMVVGIVFGYRDGDADAKGRRMFAYDMALVMAEMDRLMVRANR
jgi:S1-C subfamily serine protease